MAATEAVTNDRTAKPSSTTSTEKAREAWVLGIFAVGVLAIGLYPKPLTDLMDAPIAQLVVQLSTSKL